MHTSAKFKGRTQNSVFYRLAGRALADREHTKLIRICVSLVSDTLVVTLLQACTSHLAFSLEFFLFEDFAHAWCTCSTCA